MQPRATEHIPQILDIVKDLIDSGHAYVAKNGDVYFRVKSDPGYGKLSHRIWTIWRAATASCAARWRMT